MDENRTSPDDARSGPPSGAASRRSRGGRDTAAATVVGAILVMTLVVVALVIFRTSFVPVLEEDAEQRSMDEAAESLLGVRSDLDAHVGEQRPGRLSVPLSTSSDGAVPLAPTRPDDEVGFRSEPRSVTVYAPSATVWERNGTLLVREDPDWRVIPGTRLTIGEIDEVLDLRLRFPSVSAADGGDSVSVRVLGSDAGFQGEVTYRVEQAQGPDQAQVIAEVENSDHDAVFAQTIASIPEAQTNYEIDVMDHLVAFDHILETASKPMRIVFIDNIADVSAERAMTYRVRDQANGTTVVEPGGGMTEEPLIHTYEGGVLRYDGRNSFFVDQTYRVEHGALLLQQGDRSTLKAGPHASSGLVSAQPLDDRFKAGFGIPLLSGHDQSVAGSSTVSVTTETVRRTSVSALAPEASLNVTTAAPSAWEKWMHRHYADAGLSAALGQYEIETGEDWINVTVAGPSLLDTTDDVHLDVQTAKVRTTLER